MGLDGSDPGHVSEHCMIIGASGLCQRESCGCLLPRVIIFADLPIPSNAIHRVPSSRLELKPRVLTVRPAVFQ